MSERHEEFHERIVDHSCGGIDIVCGGRTFPEDAVGEDFPKLAGI